MSLATVQEEQPSVQEMPLERVEAELCTLAGQMAAAMGRFLRLLADFDVRDGWAGWGVRSCAHWLSWRCGLDLRTAREYVRVARALQDLPKVSSELAQGRISYSKARAVSRVATPENEDDLVRAALHNPAAHLDRLVRGLLKAGRNDDEPDSRPRPQKQVQPRPARIDDGPALRDGVLRMLACGGRVQLAVDAADGRTLDLGRKRRRPNSRQLDALWRRDRGCAHPGCGRTRFLHAHHVTPWAAGGRTDLDNLVLLCGEHHRHLHDGGFTIVGLGRQRFRFHGPRGAVRPHSPKMAGDLTRLTQAYPDITPGTIGPDWDGSPLDLPHAVDVFLTGWANRAARPAARPAARTVAAATSAARHSG